MTTGAANDVCVMSGIPDNGN